MAFHGPAISLIGVRKSFGDKVVLDGIDLRVEAGQSACVCGVNGSGKSTLLRLVAGLLRPGSGSVELLGHDMARPPSQVRAGLGVISHSPMVYADLTVSENLSFFAGIYGARDPEARIDELISKLNLSAYRFDRAGVLSRGLLQRLSIARALVHEPAVLLADEPSTGLDAEASGILLSILEGFTAAGGAVLMATHDVEFGIRCCRKAAVLDGRRISFEKPVSDIDTAAFTKDYLAYAGKSH
jgi:heme exporter protein A